MCSGFAAKYASSIEKRIGEKMSLIIIPFVPVIAWLLYANFAFVWIIPLAFVVNGLRGFFFPVLSDFVQRHISSDRRATVMSITSFCRQCLFVAFAPFVGWVTDVYSVQVAFMLMAGILFVYGVITLLMLKKVKIL